MEPITIAVLVGVPVVARMVWRKRASSSSNRADQAITSIQRTSETHRQAMDQRSDDYLRTVRTYTRR